MKPEVAEWVAKAEGDWNSTLRETRARKSPNHDAACFHAQQCIEKYLKALLVAEGSRVPRIHDLSALAALLPNERFLRTFDAELAMLTTYAVAARYPGLSADKLKAREAKAAASRLRDSLRSRLGLQAGAMF